MHSTRAQRFFAYIDEFLSVGKRRPAAVGGCFPEERNSKSRHVTTRKPSPRTTSQCLRKLEIRPE